MHALCRMTAACLLITVAACAQHDAQQTANGSAESQTDLIARAGAPLFSGMGEYDRKITTNDPGAQSYFNQGMVLAFGFNHAESVRSFRAAQRLDPACAMCFWGEALATGPNINVTADGKAVMMPQSQIDAYAAIQKAIALKANGTDRERGLIDALAKRYSAEPVENRDAYDLAWARALGELRGRFPDDDDIAAMYAEAWMNTMPWDYWSDSETPRPEAAEAIAALEETIARNPKHALALHLYIHAVEASSSPERAENAADALANLVPGSGHLVHMPAHIYWRIGRYNDASNANVRAAQVDEEYIAQCNAQGFYPALYYPHNIHFLWAASSMEGRSELAIQSARKVAANIRMETIEEFPMVEFFHTIPLLALTQFGRWDEVLAEPVPDAKLDYSNAISHYVRGVAQANLGNLDAARAEHAALLPLKESEQIGFLVKMAYPAQSLLDIADVLLRGEIAMAAGDLAGAIPLFEQAVAYQDELPYTEPPFWYYPTRQSLGVALYKAGRFADAEAVYRTDLVNYPKNGWSMYGLIQSLRAQDRVEEADEVEARFADAWAMADVELMASRM